MNLFEKANWDLIDKNTKLLCKGYPKKSLFITGEIGTGKTFLAVAIGKLFADYLFTSPFDINREIRSCDRAWQEKEKIMEYVFKKHLIIDDLGAEKITEFDKDNIYEILNKKCLYNEGGLIITSNLSIQEIANAYNDRIASRLTELCKVVKLEGKDRRLSK